MTQMRPRVLRSFCTTLRVATVFGLVCAPVIIHSPIVHAFTIGVNFYGNPEGALSAHPMARHTMETETAGAPGYVQTNWNDIGLERFSSGANYSDSEIPLHNSAGAATDITLGYASEGAWGWAYTDYDSETKTADFVPTPDTMLLSGYALMTGSDDHQYVFFGNVPDGEYQVVLYTVGPFTRSSTYTVSNGDSTNVYTTAPMLDGEYLGLVDPPGLPGLGYQSVLDPTDDTDPAQTSSYVVMDAAPNENGNIGITIQTNYFDAWSAIQLFSVGGSQPGDFDLDGDVDGQDFLEWQRADGTPQGLDDWQSNYGAGPVLSVAAVPEPCTAALLSILILSAGIRHQRRTPV